MSMKKEYSSKQKQVVTAVDTAHVVGTKYPKDFYYRKQYLPFVRYTLCMPDGMICSVQVFEGEDSNAKLRSFVDNWYKVTKQNPEIFDHFKINDKCPICGGDMMCHILDKGCRIWCLNYPDCEYVETEDSMKTRERTCKKHGIKFSIVRKSGSKVVLSNKPQNSKDHSK